MQVGMVLLCAALAAGNPTNVSDVSDDVTRQQQLQALEQVKMALYDQLRAAVADTVTSLNNTAADGDAQTALLPMAELQRLLEENQVQQDAGDQSARRRYEQRMLKPLRADAHSPPPDAAHAPPVDSDMHPPSTTPSTLSTPAGLGQIVITTKKAKDRRAQGAKSAQYWYNYFNMGDITKLNFDEQGFVITGPKSEAEKKKARHQRQENEMLIKIQNWIKWKQELKKKKEEWRQQQRKRNLAYEKCPRHGMQKKKAYPCCRKCCKASYLGCL